MSCTSVVRLHVPYAIYTSINFVCALQLSVIHVASIKLMLRQHFTFVFWIITADFNPYIVTVMLHYHLIAIFVSTEIYSILAMYLHEQPTGEFSPGIVYSSVL